MTRGRADELRRQAPVRALVARLLGVGTEERDFRIGAEGEEIVAWRLRRLDPSCWRTIHSVPVGHRGSDIDHVVIGPPGVFTLNTKHHPGGRVWVEGDTMLVNGRQTWYVRNGRHEAARAARMLGAACGYPVAVRPLIVVVGARLVVRRQPADVHVVGQRTAVRWLRRQQAQLTPGEVRDVFEMARRDTTWRTSARSADAGSDAAP